MVIYLILCEAEDFKSTYLKLLRFSSVVSLKDCPKSSDRLVSDNALFRSTTKWGSNNILSCTVFFSDFMSLLLIRIAGWVQLDSGRTRKFAFILRVELIKRSQWVLLQTQQMTRAPAHQLCKMIKMMRRVSINFLTCTVDLITIKMSISLLLQNIIGTSIAPYASKKKLGDGS